MTILEAAEFALYEVRIDRVYLLNEVPAGAKYPYVVLSASTDLPTTYTLDAAHGVLMERVTTQSFGRTLTEALRLDALARSALLDRRLPLYLRDCGPGRMQVGAAVVRDPDTQGVIGVTSTYLFATTKET